MPFTETYGPFEHNRYDADTYSVERRRVLALQALLMSELMPIARTTRRQDVRPPKATGFVFLQEQDHIHIEPVSEDLSLKQRKKLLTKLYKEQIKDRSVDEYFGVMARRLTPRERRLTVSVLKNTTTPDKNQAHSIRTVHQFLWRSDSDEALGLKRDVIATSDRELLMSSVSDDQLELMQTGGDYRIVVTGEPTGADFQNLEHLVTKKVADLKDLS